MKIAAAVPLLVFDKELNIVKIIEMIKKAAANGADMVLFPEAVLTGLVNCDVYEQDIRLANTLNDELFFKFKKLACDLKIWMCFGFFELCDGRIYDSAVLLNDDGEIALHYRRINPQWRAKNLPESQYAEGASTINADTPFGTLSIVICGDLFDDRVLGMIVKDKPDILLYPFARCFSENIRNQQDEWENTEKDEYIKQAAMTGCTVIMANYIADESMNGGGFGGALIVSKKGDLLASLPIKQEGILYYDLPGAE